MPEKRSMFNPIQKQEYIDYEKNNSVLLTQCFKRLSECEKLFSKDVTDMTEEELKSLFSSLDIRREDTRSQIISLLRGYINWAKLTGKTDNNSAIFKLTAATVGSQNSIVQKMLKDKQQMEDVVDKGIDRGYFLQENRAARDELIFRLLYEGLTIKELTILKKKDINLAEKTVVCASGKTIEIDDKILSLWNQCTEMTKIEKSGERFGKDILYYDLVDGDIMFRTTLTKKTKTNDGLTQNVFMKIIAKIFAGYKDATSIEILATPANINASGGFYRTYLAEKNGEKITQNNIAKYLKKEYDYDSEKQMLSAMRKWKIDYEDWKIAFGYM